MLTETVRDLYTSPIRRLTDDGLRWRVVVETWRDRDAFHGRFLFRREVADDTSGERESSTMLHGPSREHVLSLAHDLPEDRLRRVLHSLV